MRLASRSCIERELASCRTNMKRDRTVACAFTAFSFRYHVDGRLFQTTVFRELGIYRPTDSIGAY